MIDAKHHTQPGTAPAEHCLVPQLWLAPVDLERARGAALASRVQGVRVYANHGRWIAECSDCNDAQLAAPEDPRFMCRVCANASAGGKWRPAIWPKDHARLGELLDERPRTMANWLPGETVKDIIAENKLLAAATDLSRVGA